jgi:hypothetical protein
MNTYDPSRSSDWKSSRSLARLSGVALSLALAGCDAEFDPGTLVSSLRVLAVQANSPFAAPGDTVRLQALSYDPAARPITWAWAICENPASSSVEGCLADIALAAAASGTSPLIAMGEGQDNLEFTIPANVLDAIAPEARPQALVGVLSVACPGTLDVVTDAGAVNGRENPLPMRCTDAAGNELTLHDYIVGIKRVFLRETDLNQNPVIERITFDGEDWPEDEVKEVDPCDTNEFLFDDCKGKGDHRIAALLTPDSFQTGRDEFERNFEEQLIVQHYATDGIFKDEVRVGQASETSWVARSGAAGSEVTVWFVARDDRGGVSWATRRVRAR